jgi:hypothetical protein
METRRKDTTIYKTMLCPTCRWFAPGIATCERSGLPVSKPVRGAVNCQCATFKRQQQNGD